MNNCPIIDALVLIFNNLGQVVGIEQRFFITDCLAGRETTNPAGGPILALIGLLIALFGGFFA